MKTQVRLSSCVLAVVFATSGCASAGPSNDQLRSTVFATHRIVQDLNENLTGSVSRLSGTTAELAARIDSSDQQTRELMSVAQENQFKLEQLQRSLDTLTATLYRHLNLSPPEPAILPQPTRPIGSSPSVTTPGDIIVEPPPTTQPTAPSISTAPPSDGLVTPTDPETQSIDADVHYREAQQLYANEDYQVALAKFAEHLSLFPDSAHAVNAAYWRAHCYFKMGDYPEAITGFEALRQNSPDSGKVPIAMHNQAVAYSRLGQNERAIELFQRLIREHPDDVATQSAREKLRQLQNI